MQPQVEGKRTVLQSLVRGGIAAGFLLLLGVLLILTFRLLFPEDIAGVPGVPQSELPSVLRLGMAFAIGTILLLSILIAFAFVGRKIDGDDPGERGALSLPHGSISAVLALLILIVFSLTSVHIFTELRAGEDAGIESRGVTQEALAALPDDRILEIQAEPAVADQPQTYIVKLSNPHTSSSDFADELMTIFSTLLIAIVGFYFGQGATAAGVREAKRIKGERDKERADRLKDGPEGADGADGPDGAARKDAGTGDVGNAADEPAVVEAPGAGAGPAADGKHV